VELHSGVHNPVAQPMVSESGGKDSMKLKAFCPRTPNNVTKFSPIPFLQMVQ